MNIIYESPDKGQTIYFREFYSLEKHIYDQNKDSYYNFNESAKQFVKEYNEKYNER